MAPHITPLLHPAAILRGRWVDEPAQVTYLKRWSRVAKRDPSYAPDDVNQLPPRSIIFPSVVQFQRFASELRELAQPAVALDIESAGDYIICIGLTQLDLATGAVGSTLNLPIRLRGGRQAWPRPVLEQHVLTLDSILSDTRIAIITHNGIGFDIPLLERHGFTVAGPLFDTMILQHLSYPEMRKGLQYTATLMLGASHWKSILDEAAEAEEKG